MIGHQNLFLVVLGYHVFLYFLCGNKKLIGIQAYMFRNFLFPCKHNIRPIVLEMSLYLETLLELALRDTSDEGRRAA